MKPVTLKICKCCRKVYTREEFLALALPSNGIGSMGGLLWRNCACRSTLGLEEK